MTPIRLLCALALVAPTACGGERLPARDGPQAESPYGVPVGAEVAAGPSTADALIAQVRR